MKTSWPTAVATAVLLTVLAGCSADDPVSKTTSVVIGVTSGQTTVSGAQGSAGQAGDDSEPGSAAPPLNPVESESTAGSEPVPPSSPDQSTSISVEASGATEAAVARCNQLLSRGEIGRRIGAGFATEDRTVLISPDPVGGLLSGLTCLYAVDNEYPAGIVQVVVNDFADSDAAAAWVAGAVSSRVAAGAVSTPSTVGGLPAVVLVLDAALLVSQVDTQTLTVSISAGVVLDPELVGAVTALAEYTVAQL